MQHYSEHDLQSLASGQCIGSQAFRAILADAEASEKLATLVDARKAFTQPDVLPHLTKIPKNYSELKCIIEKRGPADPDLPPSAGMTIAAAA